MNKGIIKRTTDKGYGFIEIEGMEKHVFFHSTLFNENSDIIFDELEEGTEVMCEFEDAEKGYVATRVELATNEPTAAAE